MRNMIVVAALLALYAGSAHCETYTYACKVGGKTFPLKVFDDRKELTWKGKTYKTTDLDPDNAVCPRFGWKVERAGDTFNLCTATQGSAGFEQNGSAIQCDQVTH